MAVKNGEGAKVGKAVPDLLRKEFQGPKVTIYRVEVSGTYSSQT